MASIRPFLWFNGQAAEAAAHYGSVFEDVAEVEVIEGLPSPVLRIGALELYLFDGGDAFTFNEAISLFVSCVDQQEVDQIWDALVDGGQPVQCGWLKDRFGVSWQVVPEALGHLLGDPDRKKAAAVHQAMMAMVKLDVAGLEAAWASA